MLVNDIVKLSCDNILTVIDSKTNIIYTIDMSQDTIIYSKNNKKVDYPIEIFKRKIKTIRSIGAWKSVIVV